MKKLKTITQTSIILFVFLTSIGLTTTSNPYQTTTVSAESNIIFNSKIENKIREAINKPTGEFTNSDLESITKLNLSNLALNNIDDLVYLPNLKELNLAHNQIEYLDTLSYLDKLEVLELQNNNIDSISDLYYLSNLKELNLSNNNISLIDDIAYLDNLEILNIASNQIEDISPLSRLSLSKLYASYNTIKNLTPLENMHSLNTLWADHNQIEHIDVLTTHLGLKSLHLNSNQITDISNLYHLTNLEDLWLHDNNIEDIVSLKKLYQLKVLFLQQNKLTFTDGSSDKEVRDFIKPKLSDYAFLPQKDINETIHFSDKELEKVIRETINKEKGEIFVKDVASITNLDATKRNITNISPLKFLTNIRELRLSHNQFSDLSALENLTQLKSLYLNNNRIDNARPLRKLVNLERLGLANNSLSDISMLYNLNSLEYLNLSSNDLFDVYTLEHYTRLKDLDLSTNLIKDIKPIASLNNLDRLWVTNNRIKDLSPLAELNELDSLYAGFNYIHSIEPLKGLRSLNTLNIENNEIDSLEPIKYLTGLEYLNTAYNAISTLENITALDNLVHLNVAHNNISSIDEITHLSQFNKYYHSSNNAPLFDIRDNPIFREDFLDTEDTIADLTNRGVNVLSDQYNERTPITFPAKFNVPVDKEWHIKFNQAPQSKYSANIKVINVRTGKEAPVSVSRSGQALKIIPVEDYSEGETYKLSVNAGIRFSNSTLLQQPYTMTFTVINKTAEPTNTLADLGGTVHTLDFDTYEVLIAKDKLTAKVKPNSILLTLNDDRQITLLLDKDNFYRKQVHRSQYTMKELMEGTLNVY